MDIDVTMMSDRQLREAHVEMVRREKAANLADLKDTWESLRSGRCPVCGNGLRFLASGEAPPEAFGGYCLPEHGRWIATGDDASADDATIEHVTPVGLYGMLNMWRP